MKKQYIIGIDQSTQGTKALLLDWKGQLICRSDLSHRQLVSQEGWISHDLEEIYRNTVQAVRNLLEKSSIEPKDVIGIGISNQRETTAAWDKRTGKAACPAIVWQCARAEGIAKRMRERGLEEAVKEKTGIPLSPYFPACKMTWLIENDGTCKKLKEEKALALGTIDSWLIFKMTKGKVFKTDYSNASRTQLFNILTLEWDDSLCEAFGIDKESLAKVCDSDSLFGMTDLEGTFEKEIPIYAVMGDSHAALYGQGCHQKGMVKATYGTGSSVMMNIGSQYIRSQSGLITSLAWSRKGQAEYVLEGNINYTGAVITWLKDSLQLISSAAETQELAEKANPEDTTYIVPAFSGLGAPYWKSEARAAMIGMIRSTGRNEIVKAAVESIAYQITDVIDAMKKDIDVQSIGSLRVDGGPTKNAYLMQFQSDIANVEVQVPEAEELSGIGAAFMAGIAAGLYNEEKLFEEAGRRKFKPQMSAENRNQKYSGWREAVKKVLL